MAGMAQVRPYRGIDAAERLAGRRRRLLDAGLDLLGAPGQDPAELTVRAICGQAGLGVRYFYESFTDKDHFVGAVFDSVIADIAATTQAAVAAAPPGEQARAAMANVVRTISADTRVGRLLFSVELSNTVIVRKRAESIGAVRGAALRRMPARWGRWTTTTSRPHRISRSAASARPSAHGCPAKSDSTTTNWSTCWPR